jgi:hypothetical protein
MDVSHGIVKKAGLHRAVRFDNSRHPGRVAAWSYGLFPAEARPEVTGNSSKFVGAFSNEAGFDVVSMFLYQGTEFPIEFIHLHVAKRDLGLTHQSPTLGAIECRRPDVG